MTTKVVLLREAPSPERAAALARFEARFDYPLGPGRRFRIDHGEDYPRFFRAMGEGACFVAERRGEVLGVVGASLRTLLLPGGAVLPVVYVGDLKVAPEARGGGVLLRLLDSLREWVGGRASAAYCVVMDGTESTPFRTTGRFGIEPFVPIGRTSVLRLSVRAGVGAPEDVRIVDPSVGEAMHQRLCGDQVFALGGDPEERSATTPLWLAATGDGACGRIEDTERAKRLIDDGGGPMRSAHLSRFAYTDLQSTVALLRAALFHAAARGLPAVFTAVNGPEVEYLSRTLAGVEVVLARATLYGYGIEPDLDWNLDTAEI